MSEYIISEKALEDINDIWIYTAENWSVEQADRYYNLIIDEIEYIVDNLDMARDFGKIRKSYRYSKVKSHLIFFKKDKTNEIEVVRVLHERMDIENRLAERYMPF
ncbi:type II toxin-antitoxin system RelE/ParE family toxin [Flavobacterium sp.]|uniref:type II toxin-antitoxin system RelE/ParE family toxin n=1 Tax=Flavobacterium sp. TaxID=239 RepID=UPI003C3DED3E